MNGVAHFRHLPSSDILIFFNESKAHTGIESD